MAKQPVKAVDTITGMMKEDLVKSRLEITRLQNVVREVVNQHEEGLVTADEMANRMITNAYEILDHCKRIGGWLL